MWPLRNLLKIPIPYPTRRLKSLASYSHLSSNQGVATRCYSDVSGNIAAEKPKYQFKRKPQIIGFSGVPFMPPKPLSTEMRKFRPTTPGQRHRVLTSRKGLWGGRPNWNLTLGKHRADGRGWGQKITTRARGGGAKRLYRMVTFKSKTMFGEFQVLRLEYDPNRTGRIALVEATGEIGAKRISTAEESEAYKFSQEDNPELFELQQKAEAKQRDDVIDRRRQHLINMNQTIQNKLGLKESMKKVVDKLITKNRLANAARAQLRAQESEEIETEQKDLNLGMHDGSHEDAVKSIKHKTEKMEKKDRERIADESALLKEIDIAKEDMDALQREIDDEIAGLSQKQDDELKVARGIYSGDPVKPKDVFEGLNREILRGSNKSDINVRRLSETVRGRQYEMEVKSSQAPTARGTLKYILMPHGLIPGQKIVYGPHAPFAIGNCLPLKYVPQGMEVYNIENQPGKGAQFVRTAGASAVVLDTQTDAKGTSRVLVRLSSLEQRWFLGDCYASLGRTSNINHKLVSMGKAGAHRWLGFRPMTRGSAKNAVDHGHGGKNKGKGGHPLVSWKGKAIGSRLAGVPTRNKKAPSAKFVVKFSRDERRRKLGFTGKTKS